MKVKICGITTDAGLEAVIAAKADFVGFVFVPASRHALDLSVARRLSSRTPANLQRVGLLQDAENDQIAAITAGVPLDFLQLHGTESPARVADIKARTGLSIIKALSVQSAADLDRAAAYTSVADWLLFDASPPKGSSQRGGHGIPFDWSLLQGRSFPRPWMLAGGLNPLNITAAIRQTGAKAVDVSSGVETDGQKDAGKIGAFIMTARQP
jgi:phosphoribosylanthranilate isomerase